MCFTCMICFKILDVEENLVVPVNEKSLARGIVYD